MSQANQSPTRHRNDHSDHEILKALLSQRSCDVDADSLQAFGERFGLLALLYVQDAERAGRRGSLAYRAQWANTMTMLARWSPIADTLNAEGIEWMWLKGPPLSEQLHGDHAARDVGDIDVLVRPADLDRAASVLLARGFSSHPRWVARGRMARAYVHALPFRRSDLCIDLHHRLRSHPLLHLDHRGIWDRSENQLLQGRRVRVPDRSDTLALLLLGLHDDLGRGTEHPRSFLDLQTLLGSVDDVRSMAVRHGIERLSANVLYQLDLFAESDWHRRFPKELIVPLDLSRNRNLVVRRWWALRQFGRGFGGTVLATGHWVAGLPFRLVANREPSMGLEGLPREP